MRQSLRQINTKQSPLPSRAYFRHPHIASFSDLFRNSCSRKLSVENLRRQKKKNRERRKRSSVRSRKQHRMINAMSHCFMLVRDMPSVLATSKQGCTSDMSSRWWLRRWQHLLRRLRFVFALFTPTLRWRPHPHGKPQLPSFLSLLMNLREHSSPRKLGTPVLRARPAKERG